MGEKAHCCSRHFNFKIIKDHRSEKVRLDRCRRKQTQTIPNIFLTFDCQPMPLSRLWHGQDVPAADDSVSAAGYDGSMSSSDTDSSINRSESESSSNVSKDELAELQEVVKRRKQTEKARLNSVKARMLRKHAKNVDMKPPEHAADSFRKDIMPDSDINRPGTVNVRFKRLRLLFSWFKAWGREVVSFFNEKTGKVNHTILVSVVDDTNMRLSEVPDGAPQWRMSRTVSVMNNIQNLVVNYDLEGAHDPCHKHFAIHTPLACLPKSDTNGISSEFVSRLFCFLGCVSQRYRSWNVPSDLMRNVPLQALVMVFDSLKTNVAVLKQFRQATHMHHKGDLQRKPVCPLFATFCLLHQLALARTPILFGFNNYWGTVVRLAHLFEGSGFRLQFKAALISVICDSFAFIPVLSLPSEAHEWRGRRSQIFNCHCPRHGTAIPKRIRLHLALSGWDNSDPMLPAVTHWCVGECCSGSSVREKESHALMQLCKHFMLLFGFGFPVPLTYRWVHAQRALQYVKEPRFPYISFVVPFFLFFFQFSNHATEAAGASFRILEGVDRIEVFICSFVSVYVFTRSFHHAFLCLIPLP